MEARKSRNFSPEPLAALLEECFLSKDAVPKVAPEVFGRENEAEVCGGSPF